uniref:hypothetical protein n=1 Tax=Desulfosoma caldarium TaxID=610254 RepID=UPI0038B33DA8
MFAIIAPGLITEAFAERLKFSSFLPFPILSTLLVYFSRGLLGVGRRMDWQAWRLGLCRCNGHLHQFRGRRRAFQ